MLRHKLIRVIVANQAILGVWKDPADLELCRTLENPFRKTTKDSAIPSGIYKCVKDNTGKFQFYKVLNVPNRSNIEIHQGNYESDTEGCILVGESWSIINNKLAVTKSMAAIQKLRNILPSEFELEIIDAA
jgi:hypothetical protein